MTTITTRSGKGSPLTNDEVDANFTNLNDDKAELSGAAFTGAITTTSTIDGRDVAADGTKLDGIEASADVTDTANVTAAGALMDSEVINLAQVKAFDSADYATAAQGTTADSALQNVVEDTTPQLGGDLDLNSNDITGTGNIDVTGTVTADGLTVDGTATTAATFNTNVNGAQLEFNDGTASTQPWYVGVKNDGTNDFLIYNLASENIELYTAGKIRQKTSSNGDVSLYNDAGTSQDLYWDASTSRLGLGAILPATKLDVVETVATATNAIWTATNLSLKDDRSYAASVGGSIIFEGKYNTAGSYSTFGFVRGRKNDGTDGGFQGGMLYGARGGDHVFVSTASGRTDGFGECMRIQGGSGNIGIGTGTLTDSYKMIIDGSDQETADLTDAGTHGATLFLRATGEDAGSGGAVAFGTTNGNKRPFAAIKGLVLDGTANSVGNLAFSTRATTSATNLTERMRLTQSGRLGLGDDNPQAKFVSVADSQYGEAARFANNGDATSWARADWVNDQASGSGIIYRDNNGEFVIRNDNSSGTAMNTTILAGGSTAGVTRFFRDTSNESMRIDSSGHLLVGTTDGTPYASNVSGAAFYSSGAITGSVDGLPAMYLNRKTSDGTIADFRKDGTTVGSIGNRDSANLYIAFRTETAGDGCGLTGSSASTGAIIPSDGNGDAVDDHIDLGATGTRFDDIYATNGTIQTSDRNEKQDIEALSDAEQRVAVAAKGLLRKFRWIDSVEEKGDDARIHFGIIAQDLQDAFTAEGLDAGRYAMFISTTWTDEETGEERTRMGVRYSELLAFIIAAI